MVLFNKHQLFFSPLSCFIALPESCPLQSYDVPHSATALRLFWLFIDNKCQALGSFPWFIPWTAITWYTDTVNLKTKREKVINLEGKKEDIKERKKENIKRLSRDVSTALCNIILQLQVTISQHCLTSGMGVEILQALKIQQHFGNGDLSQISACSQLRLFCCFKFLLLWDGCFPPDEGNTVFSVLRLKKVKIWVSYKHLTN